jgi:hypothetical protein
MNLRWNYERKLMQILILEHKTWWGMLSLSQTSGWSHTNHHSKITMIKSIDHSEKIEGQAMWKEHEATLMCGFKVSQNQCYKKGFQAKVWHHITELRNNLRQKTPRTLTPQQQAPHSKNYINSQKLPIDQFVTLYSYIQNFVFIISGLSTSTLKSFVFHIQTFIISNTDGF